MNKDWAVVKNWKVNARYPKKDNYKLRNKILRQFLDYYQGVGNIDEKLAALKEIANMNFDVSYKPINERIRNRREKFDKYKHRKLDINGGCNVCGRKADVRHHIIQLQKGGTNGPHNLVLLCNPCHEEIHPWMKRSAT